MKKINIVSFSGGKDSTCMLLKMIEKNIKIDEIIFCDTGVEFPEMYKHIEKIDKYVFNQIGIHITKLKSKYNFEHWLLHHVKTKGKNKGKKGYSFPDFRNRWCTQVLKKQVVKSYLKKYKDCEVVEFHGIALDEIERAKKNKEKTVEYPLINWKLKEKDCLEYCYNLGYDWDGLYKKFERVSCWCCPLSRLAELKILWKEYPHLWNKLKDWQDLTYRKFRSDYNIFELEEKFKKEKYEK